jgi:adenylosuccinate lyase
MIARYTRPEMGAIWSDQGRFERWLEVELAATDTLAERGVVPKQTAQRMRERAKVAPARILEIEGKVNMTSSPSP